MKREHFVQDFSRRLTAVMQGKGLNSSRSRATVKINKLAEVANCSPQMARRYALGEALPDIHTTYNIAKWLDVSAGWLMFGEETVVPSEINSKNYIQIDQALLEYILTKALPLNNMAKNTQELSAFIIDIIHEATQMRVDRKAIFKMIDITIHSATRFNDIKQAARDTTQTEHKPIEIPPNPLSF